GSEGTRTPDPLHAMQVRYQLRHRPGVAPPGQLRQITPRPSPLTSGARPRDGSVLPERGVEGRLGHAPEEAADEADRLRRAAQAVHAGVLPLDRDRALVADRAEGTERVLPRNVAVAGGDEVPAAPRV